MTEKLNAVVIGVGALGQHHARIYANHPKTRLAAIADIEPNARVFHSQKWNCQSVADLDEIQERIDLASVVVPTVAHFDVARRLIERGVPVLIEKPVTLTVEEGNRLIRLAEEKHVVIQVGHIERFNPAILALGGRLQAPLFIESHRLGPPAPRVKDVGVILDLMIHDLDLIMSLAGSEVESIDAVGVPILTPQEDIANARIHFCSGCVANVTVSRVTPERQRKIRFFQQDMYLSVDFLKPELQIYRKIQDENGRVSIQHEQPVLAKEEPLAVEIGSFIECVLTGGRPVVTGQDGVRALELARRITDQASTVTQKVLHVKMDGSSGS